jgi:hypothetical protein
MVGRRDSETGGDKEGSEHALQTSRVALDAIDEVPEEFTIYKPKVGSPNRVCVR